MRSTKHVWMLGKDLSKGRHCSSRSESGPGPEGAALCEDGRMDAAAGAWRSAICLVKWGGVSWSGRGSGWRWVAMRGGAWRPWAWSDKQLQKTTGSWEGLRRLGRLEGRVSVHWPGGKNNCSLTSTTWQHLLQVIACPETTWSNLT